MPELPEAETIARQLARGLTGRRLERVVHLRRDIIRHGPQREPTWVTGTRVIAVTRRGTRPIVQVQGDRGIIFHLGMTGYLGLHPANDPVSPHTHLRIALADSNRELRFSDARRFGGVSFYELVNGSTPRGIADLGPEPLEITARQFRKLVARRRQVKALLMDQSTIAGLGNIYCDEALHRAGIHPLEVSADVDDRRIGKLCRAIKGVLRAAIRHEGKYHHQLRPSRGSRRIPEASPRVWS